MLRTVALRAFAAGLALAVAASAYAFTPELDGVTWRVVEIEGQPVDGAGSLVFQGDGISGEAACNRIMGSWKTTEREGHAFGPLATTRKMCDEAKMTKEQQLLKALERMQGYKLEGSSLLLLDGERKPAVRLQK